MSKTHEISDGEETPVLTNKHRFFNNILLATDFSPASDRALEYAASLARRYCSMVYLTHIITVDGYPMVSPEFAASSLEKRHAEAENKFRELLKSGRLFALPRKAVIQEGNLWASIENLIEEYHIDLLVVGTHGVSAVRKVLIGSVAEEIFRKAKVPVLTVGPSTGKEPMYDLEFKNILFATDFGRSAEREAEYAFSLAQEHCSRLRLVHVLRHSERLRQGRLGNGEREHCGPIAGTGAGRNRTALQGRFRGGRWRARRANSANRDRNERGSYRDGREEERKPRRKGSTHKGIPGGVRSALPRADCQILSFPLFNCGACTGAGTPSPNSTVQGGTHVIET